MAMSTLDLPLDSEERATWLNRVRGPEGGAWRAFLDAETSVRCDFDVCAAALRAAGNDADKVFERVRPKLKVNKELTLIAVQMCGFALEHASQEFRADSDVVLTAVGCCGQALKLASEDLRGDCEIVFAAVENDGHAMKHASEELQNDCDFLLAAVEASGFALTGASDVLKDDRAFVLQAVKASGSAIAGASLALRNDREVVMASVQNFRRGLAYASKALQSDRELVFAAVQTCGLSLGDAAEELQADRFLAILAVRQNALALPCTSTELRADKEFLQVTRFHDSPLVLWLGGVDESVPESIRDGLVPLEVRTTAGRMQVATRVDTAKLLREVRREIRRQLFETGVVSQGQPLHLISSGGRLLPEADDALSMGEAAERAGATEAQTLRCVS